MLFLSHLQATFYFYSGGCWKLWDMFLQKRHLRHLCNDITHVAQAPDTFIALKYSYGYREK